MKNFKFRVDYAKSGRATCRGCRSTIAKGSLRLGIEPAFPESTDPPMLAYTQWYHTKEACARHFRKDPQWWAEHLTSTEQCQGVEALDKKNSDQLDSLFVALRENVPPELQAKSESDEDKEAPAQEPHRKPRSRAKSKKVKHEGSSDNSASEEDRADSPAQRPRKTDTGRRKSHVGTVEPSYEAESLDKETVEKINQAINSLQKNTLTQLKAKLKVNQQKISGTKQEIVERVAEAQVLGACPNCELCGAHLRWNRDTGEYTCSGKYEDGVFIRCAFKSTAVERMGWKDR